MADVLLIDDDTKMAAILTKHLAEHGLNVRAASTSEAGLAMLSERMPDVILLDISLPGVSGFDLCRTIRSKSSVPIIMLTSRAEVDARVFGLSVGADDYVSKPVDGRELVARIQAQIRRAALPPVTRGVLTFDDLRIDPNARVCTFKGQAIRLSTVEFDVLLLLAQNAGSILSRDSIVAKLTGETIGERSVDVAISRLRARLGDSAERPFSIKTVHGRGYTFIAQRS